MRLPSFQSPLDRPWLSDGGTVKGGVNRPALSREEIEARAALVKWGREIGLQPFVDDIANLFLRFSGREPDLAPVLIGSHIDSVPTGGKFDGAFGVLAALECLEAIAASGLQPRRSMEVVSWTNEEGTRFMPGIMGSAVSVGTRKLAEAGAIRDRAGITVTEALKDVLAAEEHLPRRAFGFPIAAFLEAHIEQGTELEENKKTVGVVTRILAKRTFQIEVHGAENHAATTPGERRRDALTVAANIVHALNQVMWRTDAQVRFTIGVFDVSPNQPFIIPGRVIFQIDLRHPDVPTHRKLGDLIHQICREQAGQCRVTVDEPNDEPPVEFSPFAINALNSAVRELGIPSMEMPSWAWHDARFVQRVSPTAMIFIPCKDGISHNEAESATPGDLAAGASVLAEAAFSLANTI